MEEKRKRGRPRKPPVEPVAPRRGRGRPQEYTIERVKLSLFLPAKLSAEVTKQADLRDLTFTDLLAVSVQELLERLIMLPNVYTKENIKLKVKQIYSGDKF